MILKILFRNRRAQGREKQCLYGANLFVSRCDKPDVFRPWIEVWSGFRSARSRIFKKPRALARGASFILFYVVFSLFYPRCLADDTLKKTTLIPLWSPQAQFTGYYVAYEKGIYKKYGIDLTVLEGGPDYPPCRLLQEGKADFVIMWLSSALQERSCGVNLVNIGQIFQRSSLMLIARASSGIRMPRDMEGKKVSLWEGDLRIQPKAFFKKYGVNVNVITQLYSVNLFLRGGVDVISAMWYNEYHMLIDAGINKDELTTFFFDQYGLNFPEDGIYVLEDTFKKDPDLCRAFVQASLEGWLYAFEHEEEAVDIVLKYMRQSNIPANRAHQQWMLARMKDLIVPKKTFSELGVLKQSDYELVARELYENGLLDTIPDFDSFAVRCGKCEHDSK